MEISARRLNTPEIRNVSQDFSWSGRGRIRQRYKGHILPERRLVEPSFRVDAHLNHC
jgi:hypothetical protein